MNSGKKIIMVVDDSVTSLTMAKSALNDIYDVYPLSSGLELFKILPKVRPDLILLDVSMPEMDGYEVIKKLKASIKTRDIPVIFLTSMDEPRDELTGLSLGAVDYIFKPFSPALLRRRMENHLALSGGKDELKTHNYELEEFVKDQSRRIRDLHYAVMSTVAEVVEFRTDIIGGHIERTGNYIKIMLDKIAEEKTYDPAAWNFDSLVPASMLHDVGKIMISEKILHKPGELNPEEFEEIKKHTTYGMSVIDRIIQITHGHDFLDHARIIAGTHHERWDGRGYPAGLKGGEIPLQGRIMAIVDVYDALISLRPYKQPMAPSKAEKIIMEGKGTQFDPGLVDIFSKVAPRFAELASTKTPVV